MAAAEFVFILPLLLLIVFGTIQYGVLLLTYNSLVNGTRSAARAASLGEQTNTQIAAAMRTWLPAWVPASSITVTTTPIGADRIEVNVTVPSADATVLRFGPMPANLSASIVMMRET